MPPVRQPSPVSTRTESDLMGAYLAGDHLAFVELHQRLEPVLMGYARRRVSDHALAEDLVQETFLRLHLARARYTPGRAVRPWLVTILANLMRDRFRAQKRHREVDLDAARHIPDDTRDAPLTVLARQETTRRVRQAVAALPDVSRDVVERHWFDEISFPEVARERHARLSTVKVRAHRAYKKLAAALAEAA